MQCKTYYAAMEENNPFFYCK